jgi:hypothetical protein
MLISGYCHEPDRIIPLIQAGRAREVVSLGGNFVAVHATGPEVWIITSPYGVVPYFYHKSPFAHGSSVGDVIRDAEAVWRWNFEALIDYFVLEHLTGDQTLHPDVHQTPAGSVLHWDGQQLHTWQAPWEDLHRGNGSPDRAVAALRAEVERCSCEFISASGGFDSRVLLAASLANGKKPHLVVMGGPGSTDRSVVEAIGGRFGLRLETIDLQVTDYMSAAVTLAQSPFPLPAEHWHSYIYAAKSGLGGDAAIMVGANGEFARTYFFDRGLKSMAADLLPPGVLLRRSFGKRFKVPFKEDEISGLAPGLVTRVRNREQHVNRLFGLHQQESSLRQLDHWYLFERVRHFAGSGLGAVRTANVEWRTPFLSVAWCAEVDRMKRRWKLGQNWHRYTIKELYPDLLDFPEQGVGPTMAARHRLLYWRESNRRQSIIPYFDYACLFSNSGFLNDLFLRLSAQLEDVIDRTTIKKILSDHILNGTRRRAISTLVGLAVWKSGLELTRLTRTHNGLGRDVSR